MSEGVAHWLRDHGLNVDRIILDGEIHRVDAKKQGKADGWYIGWERPIEVCVAGDWARGEQWEHKNYPRGVTLSEQKAVKNLLQKAVAKAKSARDERRLDVAADAQRKLNGAQRADIHPYLTSKGVKPHNVFVIDDKLIIPNYDTAGFIWGYQAIPSPPEKQKRWLWSQKTAGTYFQIGLIGERAFICEGYATGASIHEASGDAVFCAFSAGNLMAVAKALKGKYPDVAWVIASDNDAKNPENPGLRYGEKAAEAIGGVLTFPVFPKETEGSDFNDLFKHCGADAVKTQLQGRSMAVVTSIGSEKSKKNKSKGEDRLSPAELHQMIVMRMHNLPIQFDWPAFPQRYHIVSDDMGRKTILEEIDSEIVRHRDKQVVADCILKYVHDHVVLGGEMTARHAVACRDLWLGLTPPLPVPPEPFLDKNTTGLTFKRLEFDTDPGWAGADPPLFEEFLTRCSDWKTVCAFIGSLFYPQADRQQYLYFYGSGGDSKGAIMRLLHRIFGASAQALEPRERGDRFWNMKLYRKRLGLFFDCEDWTWFSSPTFKSILGNDPLYLESKGEAGFTDTPVCKIIAASNSKPQISSQRSDLRRLIFVEVKPSPVIGDPTYEHRLGLETEAIIRTCKGIYLELCPNHGPIPFDEPKNIAIESESDYLDAFHRHFVLEPGWATNGGAVRKALHESGIQSNQQVKKVKACWERMLGITVKHSREGTVYLGVKGRFIPKDSIPDPAAPG